MRDTPEVFNEQVCPRCGMDDVADAGLIEMDGEYVWQDIICTCGMRYTEVYKYYQTEVWHDWEEEEA